MKNSNDSNNQIYNKKADLLLFSTTLIYEQNINKVWYFIRDLNNEIKVRPNFDNLIFIKGDNTWNKGNIFSINWVGLSPFKYKCIKKYEDKNKKIIKWKIKGNIGIEIYKELNLYSITQSGKTLVKSIVSKTEKEDFNDYKSSASYYIDLDYYLLLKKSFFLQYLKTDIFSYESCIINENYSKVWKILLDGNKVLRIYSILGSNIEFSNPKIDEGIFLKFYNSDFKYSIYYKIVEIKTYKKRKEWKIKMKKIGIYNEFLSNEIEIKIFIIDNNKTQLSLLHIFKYDINQDLLKKFQNSKKETIKAYKNYIEEQNDNDNNTRKVNISENIISSGNNET